jgi:hypothetical protein
MPLEKELAVYKEQLPALLTQKGKFVVIKGDKVVDFFVTYQDAIKEGYKAFGLDSFLVKKIQASEEIHHFTRKIVPGGAL